MGTASKLILGAAVFVALNFYGGWPVTIASFTGAGIGLVVYLGELVSRR